MGCASATSIFFPALMRRIALAASPRQIRYKRKPPRCSRASQRFLAGNNLDLPTVAGPSCLCPALSTVPVMAQRAKKSTRTSLPKIPFRPTRASTSVPWARTSCCAPWRSLPRGKEDCQRPEVRLAPGSCSQSVRVGEWLLLAGQDAVGCNRVVEGGRTLAGQTDATLRHTKDIVEAAGGTLDDIAKTTVYLIAGTSRAEFTEAYENFFAIHKRSHQLPAGLTVEVQELSPQCRVEIDSLAYLGRKS